MSIGNDETTLEAKRFLHLQRKSTPLARAEVTRHGSFTTGNQDAGCKWPHFHSALYSYNITLKMKGFCLILPHIQYNSSKSYKLNPQKFNAHYLQNKNTVRLTVFTIINKIKCFTHNKLRRYRSIQG